jgi:hypothetical protein
MNRRAGPSNCGYSAKLPLTLAIPRLALSRQWDAARRPPAGERPRLFGPLRIGLAAFHIGLSRTISQPPVIPLDGFYLFRHAAS